MRRRGDVGSCGLHAREATIVGLINALALFVTWRTDGKWMSAQWKREGISSPRNAPVYHMAHRWKIRGAGHELLWVLSAIKILDNGNLLHKIELCGRRWAGSLCKPTS